MPATRPTSRPAPIAEPSFDPSKLDGLKAILPLATFEALAESLAGQLGDRIVKTVGLVESGLLSEAQAAAHDVVAVAGNLGAMRLSAIARMLEKQCKTGKPSPCLAEAGRLHDEAETAFVALRSYRRAGGETR